MAGPAWLAANVSQPAYGGQINQFLLGHGATWLYTGTVQNSQTTGSAVFSTTASQYLAQQIVTGAAQTEIGIVSLQMNTVGGSPSSATIPPLTLSLYNNSSNNPTGTALASVTVNEQYVYTAPFWVQFPLAVTGLSPSTAYQLVTSPVGNGTNYYTWQQTTQTSGASTSPDNVTWTSQNFGLMYQVFDQSVSGQIQYFYEDSGARWVQLSYNSGQVSQIVEYTMGEGGTPLISTRTFTYSGSFLTGVN